MSTLHLISHTHWDREWYQTFQQFRLRLVHLMDGLLDLLESDPHYRHFMLDGQTIVLEDYLQIRPEREADLRKYIQNGRILIGPWYLMPDEFLVSPEAIIRNFQEGTRVARRFGPSMMVGYTPDPFGHIGQFPQILRGFGIQDASLWRGVKDQPNEFWWQAPDGSRVLLGYLSQGYGNAASILANGLDNCLVMIRDQVAVLAPSAAGEDLLLMHGVDHQEAHPQTSEAVAYAAGRLDGHQLLHSTLPAYFSAVRQHVDLDRLPVVTGELRSPKHAPLLPGVLSARMWIKQRNRACETLLEKWAEPFSAWAQAFAGERQPERNLRKPQAVLRQAWRLLLQCHPHDSICGCSIDQVHDEMRPRFDQVEQMGEEITNQSLATLAGLIATQPPAAVDAKEASALVVFNPTGRARSGVVTVVIEAPSKSGAYDLVDETGETVPFQSADVGGGTIDMHLDAKMIQMGMNMMGPGEDIGFGKILGMRVLGKDADSGEMTIEFRTGKTGEPDLAEWDQSRQAVTELLQDPANQYFHLIMRSGAASRVRFTARDVPGLGYRTFWVRAKASEASEPMQVSPLARVLMPVAARLAASPVGKQAIRWLSPEPAARPPFLIENEYMAVEAGTDGALEIRDKRSGVVYRGQNRFVDGGDRGDTYNYSKPLDDRLIAARFKSARVERGDVQQVIEMQLELVIPESLAEDHKTRAARLVALPITTRVTLTAGAQRVEIHTEIDNRARDHRLRVHFAAPFVTQAADYDGHFEVVRRPLELDEADNTWSEQPRPEAPQRAFTSISDGKNGLLVANRGLPEVEVLHPEGGGSEIAVTLLRCVGWLSRDDLAERQGPAGPGSETPGAQVPGSWAFDYAVVPFQDADRLQAYWQAYGFEAPLRAVSSALHTGDLPASGSFLRVEPEAFVVSTVKQANDGQGIVLRGYNLEADPITVQVETLQPFASVERVNLAEESLEPLASRGRRAFSLEARGHEVVSVQIGRIPSTG